MTLVDFASLSTALSGVAVTASLIYLAIQTHQNTRNTRAIIHQGATARTTAIVMGMMNADYSAAWIEGNGAKATPEQVKKLQFGLQCANAINALEDLYLQHEAGLASDEQFARNTETLRGLLRERGVRGYWNAQRDRTSQVAPRFSAVVDGLCTADATQFAGRV